MSEFDPLRATGMSDSPIMQGQANSGNEDFLLKSADDGSGVAKRDSPNLDDFEKVYSDQFETGNVLNSEVVPQRQGSSLESENFSGQGPEAGFSLTNGRSDPYELTKEDSGRPVIEEYLDKAVHENVHSYDFNTGKGVDDLKGPNLVDEFSENVPSGELSPPRATSPSTLSTPLVEISFPKDNTGDISPAISISPPRDLSPPRGLSFARDPSPNRSVSSDGDSSPPRGLSPARDISPPREHSPIRDLSPPRVPSPVYKEQSPIREPSPVYRESSPVYREPSPVREPSPEYREPSPIRSISPQRIDPSPLVDFAKPSEKHSRDSSPSSRGSSPARDLISESRLPFVQEPIAREETNYQRERSYVEEIENSPQESEQIRKDSVPELVSFPPVQERKVSSSVRRSFKVFSPMVNLIYWRDVKKSGIVFGSLMVILLSLSWLSFISVVAYTSLALLTGTISFRLYKTVMQAVQKSQDGHPFKEFLDMDTNVESEKAHEATDVIVAQLNTTVTELKRLFLVEDLIDSVKFGCFLWMLTYLGSWFNGLTLIILSVVALFSLPKVYEQNQTQIDQYIGLVQTQFNDIVGKVKAAIPIGNKEKAQ